MKTIKTTIFLVSLLCCLNGCKKSNSGTEVIELRSDFSEIEFKNALIEEWQSVFEVAGKENVIYLKFDNQGKAEITIEKDGVRQEYSGDYTVDFLREPIEENVTQAEITISSPNKNIVLSWVNFGLHNAFPVDSGLFLRIGVNEPPFGVLERVE